MTFEKIINRLAGSKNILTDGRLTCSYQEIPNLLEGIGQYFLEKGVRPEDCVTLECGNTVPAALTLLYLLQKGRSFVLTPASLNGKMASDLKPIPNFCRYRLMADDGSTGEADVPEIRVSIEENEAYTGQPGKGVNAMKMYSRTSGSMGASKISVRSHAGLLGNSLNCVEKYRFESGDRVVIPIPIFHLYGLEAVFLPAVIVGASIDLQENTNILKYLGRERRFNPNIAFLTPTLCEMLLRTQKTQRAYKVVVTSGQRIKEEVFRAFDARIGGCLVNQYGSTEMGPIAACYPSDPADVRATTIGAPFPGVQLEVRNADDIGNIGELYCKPKYGFEGYVDEDGNWIHQEPSGNWYNTGDLAKTLDNGYIEVVGRADNRVNRSGFLVMLSDIEKTVETIENVEQVVVVATHEERQHGQQIAAFCIVGGGTELSGAHIRKTCFDVLPKYAIPDDVFIVDSLPKLPSGKVNRQALVAMAGK